MSRDLANLIDALIPGAIGLVLVLFPSLFVGKAATDTKRTKIRGIGVVLIFISIVGVVLKFSR
jgi:hypothetical protein